MRGSARALGNSSSQTVAVSTVAIVLPRSSANSSSSTSHQPRRLIVPSLLSGPGGAQQDVAFRALVDALAGYRAR